ncbi:hypothetical protein [Ammonifex thiophilus]|uniref:DUF1641 domain-containing protein n=1 Tax=Ammonifex thiophilus TaxID=444093 RepID=A0A3D8P5L0_9THEO|nr:hypothetical protein [Ammonifex thiophilus]RDV84623.1 hypothetical protein DXX99_00825 [Ammonifex thiophilus]
MEQREMESEWLSFFRELVSLPLRSTATVEELILLLSLANSFLALGIMQRSGGRERAGEATSLLRPLAEVLSGRKEGLGPLASLLDNPELIGALLPKISRLLQSGGEAPPKEGPSRKTIRWDFGRSETGEAKSTG